MPTPADQARSFSSAAVREQADLIESALEEHIELGATKVTLMEYQGSSLSRATLGVGFLPHGTTWPALKVVERRYKDVGWNVRIDRGSHRDPGMFIVINAEGEP